MWPNVSQGSVYLVPGTWYSASVFPKILCLIRYISHIPQLVYGISRALQPPTFDPTHSQRHLWVASCSLGDTRPRSKTKCSSKPSSCTEPLKMPHALSLATPIPHPLPVQYPNAPPPPTHQQGQRERGHRAKKLVIMRSFSRKLEEKKSSERRRVNKRSRTQRGDE